LKVTASVLFFEHGDPIGSCYLQNSFKILVAGFCYCRKTNSRKEIKYNTILFARPQCRI